MKNRILISNLQAKSHILMANLRSYIKTNFQPTLSFTSRSFMHALTPAVDVAILFMYVND